MSGTVSNFLATKSSAGRKSSTFPRARFAVRSERVNYFRIGHSTRCFSKIRDWVEMKIRRHLMRSRLRKGKGWKRWSSEWIYRRLGLYNDYRLRRPAPAKAAPVPQGV